MGLMLQNKRIQNLVVKVVIEVRGIEVVYSHVTVFSARTVTAPIGVERHAVNGAEVPFNPSELLFEHQMEKARIKLSNSRTGRGYVHSILTAAHDHMLINGAQSRGVDRPFRLVGLQMHQVLRIEQLCRVIFGSCDEHRAVLGHLHVVDEVRMFLGRVHFLSGLKNANFIIYNAPSHSTRFYSKNLPHISISL